MSKEPKYIVLDERESFIESLGKDFVTFGFLLICIYVSNGSRWWTFVTGTIFLIWLVGSIFSAARKRVRNFESKQELKAWVDSLEEDI